MFALTHQFLQQIIEGDELYTRVKKNVVPDESQGWTIVLMDRATRFIWDMHCGRKNRKMFKKAMSLLCQVIEHTGDLTLLTDGERRYGSLLFGTRSASENLILVITVARGVPCRHGNTACITA